MLAYAMLGGNVDAIRLLLHHGAKIESVWIEYRDKKIPLLALSIATGNVEIVKLLLAFGASPWTVPCELWKNSKVSSGEVSGIGKESEGQWAAPCAVTFLRHALTLHMLYLLNEAARLPPLTDKERRCVMAGLDRSCCHAHA